MLLKNSETGAVTEEEFKEKIKYLDNCLIRSGEKRGERISAYRIAMEDIFYRGSNLTEVCKKYSFSRRAFQSTIKRCGFIFYLRLRLGFVALELAKGFTMENIRERLGLSIRKRTKRKFLSDSKRWNVLKRDKFRCRHCGAGAEESKLAIDHIIPVSKFPTVKLHKANSYNNLQVLCEKCNLGKRAELETTIPKNKGVEVPLTYYV